MDIIVVIIVAGAEGYHNNYALKEFERLSGEDRFGSGGHSVSAPYKGWGLDDGASGIGQAKKSVGLAPGEVLTTAR